MERVLTSSQRKISPMPTGPKGEKRLADVIGNAVKVMRIATGEETDERRDHARGCSEIGRGMQYDGAAHAPPWRHQGPTGLPRRSLGNQDSRPDRIYWAEATRPSANTKSLRT